MGCDNNKTDATKCERNTVNKKLIYVVTEDWYFVSHRLPLAITARMNGYDVAIVTRRGNKAPFIEGAGIRVIDFAIDRGGVNPLRELLTVFRLWRLYRHESPDLVHHVAMKPVLLGGLAARLAGVRGIVNAIAGMGFLFTGEKRNGVVTKLVRRLLPLSVGRGRVIVQNSDDALELERLGVPDRNIRLIRGAGVDLERFSPRPELPGVPVVVLPARLLWDKGVEEFVGAARWLSEQGVKGRFALVGDPDPDNPASISDSDIKAWLAEGVIEHWGWCDDVVEVMRAAHIVCLPSYREGLPKSLLEAAACGRAIVATDVPGCREVVRDGDNGILVPAGDTRALARALLRLIEDETLRKAMGMRARARAESEFSQELVHEQTLAVYRELLG